MDDLIAIAEDGSGHCDYIDAYPLDPRGRKCGLPPVYLLTYHREYFQYQAGYGSGFVAYGHLGS